MAVDDRKGWCIGFPREAGERDKGASAPQGIRALALVSCAPPLVVAAHGREVDGIHPIATLPRFCAPAHRILRARVADLVLGSMVTTYMIEVKVRCSRCDREVSGTITFTDKELGLRQHRLHALSRGGRLRCLPYEVRGRRLLKLHRPPTSSATRRLARASRFPGRRRSHSSMKSMSPEAGTSAARASSPGNYEWACSCRSPQFWGYL